MNNFSTDEYPESYPLPESIPAQKRVSIVKNPFRTSRIVTLEFPPEAHPEPIPAPRDAVRLNVPFLPEIKSTIDHPMTDRISTGLVLNPDPMQPDVGKQNLLGYVKQI
jgi:hypothetical protein